MFEQLVTKENALIYLNIIIAYLVYFTGSKNFLNYLSVPILTMTVIIVVIIEKISSIQPFINFLFKRRLAQLEIDLRNLNGKSDYYKLKREYKDEIDKIDKYFLKYVISFNGLLLVSLIQISLILFQFLGFLHHRMLFQLGTINIYSEYIVLAVLILNFSLIYVNDKELKQYMLDFLNIYETYGVKDGKKRTI